MLTKKQQAIVNRRNTVKEQLLQIDNSNKGEVTVLVQKNAKRYNVTEVTIYDDIKKIKADIKATEQLLAIHSFLNDVNASTNTITGQQNLER